MTIFKLVVFVSFGFLQLASDPGADELLVTALIELEELNEAHCARCTGTISGIQKELPRVLEVFAISAKNRSLEFHSYGAQQPNAETVQWFDALRDNRSFRKRFKIRTHGSKNHNDDIPFEKEDDPAKEQTWPWPEMNPFGLVFGSESRMSRRESEFGKVRNELANQFEFQTTRLLRNRNCEGTWLALPSRRARLIIEFDRKSRNMPTVVKWELAKEKRILGLAKTTWVKYKDDFLVPETMSIFSERSDGTTVQLDLKWEWVPLDKWLKWSDQNFEGLFNVREVIDFRSPLVELFEMQNVIQVK